MQNQDTSFKTESLSKQEKHLLITALNYVEVSSLNFGDLSSQDLQISITYNDPLDANMKKACIYALKRSVNLFDPCDAGVEYYQDVLDKLETLL